MRSCAHKVHTPIGGRKDGRTEGRTEGRKAKNYVPPLFFEKAGDNNKKWIPSCFTYFSVVSK